MSQLVFFRDIHGFGAHQRGDKVRLIQEGDWLIAGPPWEFRPGSARHYLWDVLQKCSSEREFLVKAHRPGLRENHARDFLSWLKRNWWMVRAVKS